MNPHACHRFSQPVSRREALRSYGVGFGSLALAGLLGETSRGEENAAANPLAPKRPMFPVKAKRVIFLFMKGGPSTLDLFDHKPDLEQHDGQIAPKLPKLTFAAANGREGSKLWKSPWKFTPRGQSGHMVSELFPHTGELVDELCFLHSCHGTAPDHGAATLMLNTGTTSFVRPSMGSWVLYGLGTENQNLPGFISICPNAGVGGSANRGAAFLPAVYQGTALGAQGIQPSEARFRFLGEATAEQRRQLDFLRSLNEGAAAGDSELDARIRSFEMAFRMQMAAPEVLDISKENKATRDLYGLDDPATVYFGTQCLLARRFAEAGVRYIQVSSGAPEWDQHGGLVKGHAENARATDKPVAGLLRDLKSRGLLEETLVLWGGEFGRTPTREGGDGRDHNQHGYTMWLAGGGVKPGRVGATDELGYFAAENKIHIHDLHATLLALLGLDHEKLTYRYAGRDFRLTDVEGRVVPEVFS
jgi:hypothetical protein